MALRSILRTSSGKAREGEVLCNRHVREQRVILEDHADAALVRRHVGDRHVVEHDIAVRGRLESGHHHQAGGLSRAGRPEERDEFAPLHLEVEVLYDKRLAIVGLLDIFEVDDRVILIGHRSPFAGGIGCGSAVGEWAQGRKCYVCICSFLIKSESP
jgi:hypothetical protein